MPAKGWLVERVERVAMRIPAPAGGLVTVHGKDSDGNYVALMCDAAGYLITKDFGDVYTYTRQILFFDPTAAISTGTNVSATIVYRGPTLTLVRWDMRAKTAPVDSAMIFDVNVAGTSLWASNQGNRPTIADGQTSGTGTSFDTGTLSDGDVVTLDYDQVGSGTPGGQVTLTLEGTAGLEAA